MTDDVRKNIVASGAELIAALEGLCAKYPGVCTHVTGTGLMSCLHIDKQFPVVCAKGGMETELRQAGLQFVHGGDNGVRLTPHFNLTSAEIQLIVGVIEASVAKRATLNGGASPKILTTGLTDAQLKPFADDADLAAARAAAKKRIEELKAAYPKYFEMDELAAVRAVSAGFESFYKAETQTPYIAAASKGPWVVTIHGAIVHDSGGYGMLGFGHNPKAVLDAMNEEQTM